MIMCTLLAGDGVFWAAGEPMAHFLSPPPLFGVEGGTEQAVVPALAQSFMHWGFLAWAILGALTTTMLMHYHYDHDLPLASCIPFSVIVSSTARWAGWSTPAPSSPWWQVR
jgi:choline-glycine betaine transporter